MLVMSHCITLLMNELIINVIDNTLLCATCCHGADLQAKIKNDLKILGDGTFSDPFISTEISTAPSAFYTQS